ncbi:MULTISPECIES: sulfotransferase [Streptomyces]|uniref:Sulfotransferase n=1 Tax=Streptomyces lonegramiae TaxID=3075524 RepID=A0ABU2XBM8_9ACTN|nr:sulfotransferase [Streptomyces sp. DSM 41529]MDT0543323.1 sulfotransferase [Streptomyces sp. DSM 41529]
MDHISTRPLTFVVGTGRSGSTALSHVLNLHPGILSVNELFTSLGMEPHRHPLPARTVSGAEFWELVTRPNEGFDRMIRSGAPAPEFLYNRRPGRFSAETTGIPALSMMVLPHLTDDPDGLFDELVPRVSAWPGRPVARHYTALFELLAERFGRGVVVERSGGSLGWVPWMREAFPGARFVHMFRDGPDCALSMSRHPGFRMTLRTMDARSAAGTGLLARLTDEQVRALPPDLAGLFAERFDPALLMEAPVQVARFGEMWSHFITRGLTALSRVPEGSRTSLSYEQLLDAPRRELARLAEFIGVDPAEEWLTAAEATLDHGRRGSALRLPADELSALRESCAPGTEALRAVMAGA